MIRAIALVDSLTACQVDEMQLRRPNDVCLKIASFDRDGEDAVRARRCLIHWCSANLANVVSCHEQVNCFLLRLAAVDAQVLKMEICILIFVKRDFVPFFKWQFCMRSVK